MTEHPAGTSTAAQPFGDADGRDRAASDGACTGIAADRLEAALDVIREAGRLPVDHPDARRLQEAVAGLYKSVKQRRRRARRDAVRAHDDAVLSRTATAAPGRIDDETRGIPIESTAVGASAGELKRARGCYICKRRFTRVDAFHHQLCPECAEENRMRREARCDLTGRRALLTGGRAKIGMYIALKLLRDGAELTITTRFPNDAARRFAAEPDSAEWLHRLVIAGIDLRDPAQVVALADDVARRGHLDILVNNAAQTVRRTPAAYAPLVAAERARLDPRGGPWPDIVTFGRALESATAPDELASGDHWTPTPQALAEFAVVAGSASLERTRTGTAIDAGGLVPDQVRSNSWTDVVGDVDPVELLEVQLCNQTAPFILIGHLRGSLAASPARRTYIVNVSAMEGQFGRGYKGPGHPHTNMSKAALNMLVRTSAQELFETDRILMTAVDTGWITDERPHDEKVRLAEAGFHAPLDLVDGAARVYDPIVRGEAGEDVHGVFLKDYRPAAW